MTWNSFHRRGEILRDVVETADERRDGVLPMQLPGVTESFTDEIDLIGALLLKWHARLSVQVERTLGHEPLDPEAAVASAWRATAEQLPGVRLVIDRCTAAPEGSPMAQAMARAQHREWARLAAAAGLAHDQGPRALAAGLRLEALAREGLDLRPAAAPVPAQQVVPTEAATPVGPDRSADRESFVERLKAALAA